MYTYKVNTYKMLFTGIYPYEGLYEDLARYIRLRGVHTLQDIWDIDFGFFRVRWDIMTEEAKINFLAYT